MEYAAVYGAIRYIAALVQGDSGLMRKCGLVTQALFPGFNTPFSTAGKVTVPARRHFATHRSSALQRVPNTGETARGATAEASSSPRGRDRLEGDVVPATTATGTPLHT